MHVRGACAAGALGLVVLLCIAADGLASAPAGPLGRRTVDLGSSVDGRAIRAVGSENHQDSAAAVFVVGLPRGAVSRQRARRFAHAVVTVATATATGGSAR